MGPKSLNNLIIGTNFLSNRASFGLAGFKTDHNCQLNVILVNETKVAVKCFKRFGKRSVIEF